MHRIQCQSTYCFGLYHSVMTLMTLKIEAFKNILGKGENAGNQHILLFPKCFLFVLKQISISHLFCRLLVLSFWTSLKFCHLVMSELFTIQQNFSLVQIERIHGRQMQCYSKQKIFLPYGRKHYGKSRKCWLSEFSPFPIMFPKGIFLRGVKSYLVKGY